MSFENFDPVPHLKKFAHFEDLLSKRDREEIDDLCNKLRTMWTSEPMTPLQRSAGAMMGTEIDRVPFSSVHRYIGMEKTGCDYLKLYMDPVATVKANLVAVLESKTEALFGYMPIDMNLSDVFGTKWKFLPNTLPVVTEWGVKRGFKDILDNPLPDPRESHALKWQLETQRFLTEKLGDVSPCGFSYILGPYYTYNSCLRGPIDGFYDIKKYPDIAVKAFDKLYLYLVDLAKYLIEQTGVPACAVVDSLASPSFTSPAWFQKFCAPYNKKIIEDVPAMWTIAGGGQGKTDFTPLLETYAEMGYGIFMFGPPTDLVKMKQISNEKGTAVVHWALTPEMLRWYTPKQIEKRVKECLKIGAPGGKYIMGTDLPDDETPLENFLAAREAVHKYGKYPLKF